MTASVSAFLTHVRQRGAELPPALSGAILLAAVRLSQQMSHAVRPELLLVAEDRALELIEGPPRPLDSDPYAAPELRKGSALPYDPRVLVYAAGALGYELVTLFPLADEAGAELIGPLAPVIRKAIAPDRKKRYRNLDEMARAIEEIQARPSAAEERLILDAVATTPPAKKLAKVGLKRMAVPSPYAPDPAPGAEAAETPPQLHPVFARDWDPLEVPPAVFFESPVPEPEAEGMVIAEPPEPEGEGARDQVLEPEPGVVEMHESEAQQAHEPVVPPPSPDDPLPALRAEIKEQRDEILVLESRVESLSRLGTRISALEGRLKEQAAPGAGSSLARDVKQLLDERCFADAERALQGAEVQGDPVLLVRLGQALLGQPDPDGTRAARAEEAFWRAADLDPRWALPKALLGTLFVRQGKRRHGTALLRSALALDPGCAEAQAAAGDRIRRTALIFSAAGGAAIGAMALALGVSFAPRTPVAPPANVPGPVIVRVPAPVAPPAASVPLPEKEKPAETSARAEPKPVPEKPHPVLRDQPRPRKPLATAAAGDRAAAAEAVARGDRAIRSFNTKEALAAFEGALKLDPTLPGAHRGMGMVYVLQGKNAEAKAEYQKYLEAAPDAPDAEQIRRLLAR